MVVKNAGDLNIAGLACAIADVAVRTRDNKITPDELSGGTFTITNTGSRARSSTPDPQPAVLKRQEPSCAARSSSKDEDGAEIHAIRSMMYLALSLRPPRRRRRRRGPLWHDQGRLGRAFEASLACRVQAASPCSRFGISGASGLIGTALTQACGIRAIG